MKKVYVLQFSPCSSDNCGIGKYQENFMNIFANYVEIETKFFDPGPYKTRLMKKDEFNVVKHKLAKELESFDILHIQHEFALYSGSQFAQIINIAKSMDKKVVVTIHTSPSVILKSTQLSSFIINYLRQKWRHFRINKNHIYPIRKADLLITHNKNTSNDLNRYGIELNKRL